jgi:chromosome partitioning protein
MRTIALGNLKGGSGKTTACIGLAGALIELGDSVAVIDADDQQSATRWKPEGVLVITAEDARSARAVKMTLNELESKCFDFALIDLPPELADATMVGVMLCDLVLVPVRPSGLDFWATGDIVSTIEDARAVRGDGLPTYAFIPSQLTRNRLSRELAAKLEQAGETVAPGIGLRTDFAEASIAHVTPTSYAPRSRAADELRALAAFVKSHETIKRYYGKSVKT